MSDSEEHAVPSDALQAVLRHIPDFQGYQECMQRCASDHQQRVHLTDGLERSKRGIDELTRQLAVAGQLEVLPQVDYLRLRLDRLIGRIRFSVQGYGAFFERAALDATDLDQVCEYDAVLLEQVETLFHAAEQPLREHGVTGAYVADFLRRIEVLERQWDARRDYLKRMGSV